MKMKTPPEITLLYTCRISGNYSGAMAGCELDAAMDYIFVECVLLLQLAVTIMASFCRQDRGTAAHKVEMSLDFQGVRRGFEEECGKVRGTAGHSVFLTWCVTRGIVPPPAHE